MLSDSGTTASSCSSHTPTPKGSPKKSPLLSHKIRKLKKHRQRDPKEKQVPQVGDKVVTEVLVVYSWATVGEFHTFNLKNNIFFKRWITS